MTIPHTLDDWRQHAAHLRQVSADRRRRAVRLRAHYQIPPAAEEEMHAADGEARARRIDQLTEEDLPWVQANLARFQQSGEDPLDDDGWQGFLATLEQRADERDARAAKRQLEKPD